MPKIVFQPCSERIAKRNFDNTIVAGVMLDKIEPYLSQEEYRRLRNTYANGKAHVWGVHDGKNGSTYSKWLKMDAGDIVLFCRNKSFLCSAVVVAKRESQELSTFLWKSAEFKNIYFLKDGSYPIRPKT